MKIKNIDGNKRLLSSIAIGDCFISDGLYYMRIDSGYAPTAVHLVTGVCVYLPLNKEVLPVNIVGRVENDSNT